MGIAAIAGAAGAVAALNRRRYSGRGFSTGYISNQYDSRWTLETNYIPGNDVFHWAWIHVDAKNSPVMIRKREFLKFGWYVPSGIMNLLNCNINTEDMKRIANLIGYDDGWTNGYVYLIRLGKYEFTMVDQRERMLFDIKPYDFIIDGISLVDGLKVFVGYLYVNRDNYIQMLWREGYDVSKYLYDEEFGEVYDLVI